MLLLHEVSSRAHSILELPSSRLPAVQFAQEMWETAGRLLGPVAPGGGREGPVATPSRASGRSVRSEAAPSSFLLLVAMPLLLVASS